MTIKDIEFDGNGLPIREFKLEWMVADPAIVLIAKRGSGKSWVVRSILEYLSKKGIPAGIVVSKTEHMNPFYSDFFPDTFIHPEYKTELFEKLLHRQEKMCQKYKEKLDHDKKVDPRAICVMDDCLASKGSWVNDKPISELLFNGRHYKLTYILTMQFPLGIKPELRLNFDYVFLLADDSNTNIKRLYDHYASMFPNLNAFKQVFEELTKDYGCMVIVNRGNRTNLLDKIFWYRADKTSATTFGGKQFNDYHNNNYDKDYKNKKKEFNINTFIEDKKKSTFKVEKLHND